MGLSGKTKFGNIITNNIFYDDAYSTYEWAKMGILATEMEIAGLYLIAQRLGKESLGICTISNDMSYSNVLSSDDTEGSLNDMIEVALEGLY